MKFIALILSIYITALTAMPCVDNHAIDNVSNTYELSTQNHDHTSDVDLCSPFCFCNCCQTLTQINFYKVNQVKFAGSDLLVPSFFQNEIEYIISFWQPPKI